MDNWQLCPKCNGTGKDYTTNMTSVFFVFVMYVVAIK